MVKKGKFKLLSYIIEGHLIFYKSLNKNKKILAFSILETENFYPLISILNEFLNKRFLKYYSIQININEKNKKIYLLNFKDYKKDRIIKLFNLIYHKLIDNKMDLLFLTKERLEKKFFNTIYNNLNSNTIILKSSDSILINNDKNSILLDFYNINISNLKNKSSFIHNFLNLTNHFNRNGCLIFNFKIDLSDNLITMAYFVDIRNDDKFTFKIENEINKFYNFKVIEKQKLELKRFFYFLWRLGISNNYYLFDHVSGLFLNKKKYNFHDLSKFNSQFEYILLKNHIKFKRLNQHLLFINQNSLFLVLPILNYKLILKIFKKYYLRYFIYILILSNEDYNKLLKIEKVSLLDKVKIMSTEEFLRFNINVFKNDLILKNA